MINILKGTVLIMLLHLCGCVAIQNISSVGKLETRSTVTSNVFITLEELSGSVAKRSVYVRLDSEVALNKRDREETLGKLKGYFNDRGYGTVNDQRQADLVIIVKIRSFNPVDVLEFEEMTSSFSTNAMSKSFLERPEHLRANDKETNISLLPSLMPRSISRAGKNFDLTGIALGGVGGFIFFGTTAGVLGGAVATSLGVFTLNSMFAIKCYLLVADVEVSLRTNTKVKHSFFSEIPFDNFGKRKMEFYEEHPIKQYRTSVIVGTRGAALKGTEAYKESISELSIKLGGMI